MRFAIISLAVLGLACTPLTTFQSPETLTKGQTALGVGTAMFQFEKNDESPPIDVNLWLRTNASAHSDIGIKFGALEGYLVDWKWNFFRSGQFLISSDIGYARADDANHVMVAALAGTARYYAGYKRTFSNSAENIEIAFIGASFGDRWRLMPEIGFWRESGNTRIFTVYAIGIQRIGS